MMLQKLCSEVNEDTQIRKLIGTRMMVKLINILANDGDDWKILMSEIRENTHNLEDERRKYSNDHINIVSLAGSDNQSRAEIFFEEWGTSGEKLPTVGLLLSYLEKTNLKRAAAHVAKNMLQRPEIDDIHVEVPDFESITAKCESKKHTTEKYEIFDTIADLTPVDEELIKILGDKIQKFPFNVLKSATNNFDKNLKIGEGSFGIVYCATVNDVKCAVKAFKIKCYNQFKVELMIVTYDLNHSSLLFPNGVSFDHINCLIYPFMENGSLEDRLALMNLKTPLPWEKRVLIAYEIIEGLEYLHNRLRPIVHNDVKTSNILLDKDDHAKIGDFGLNRKKNSTKTSFQSCIQGSDCYMAPEAFYGKSTPKSDVFSYGMVILELLTGLPIISTDGRHLKTYIEDEFDNQDNESIEKLLDEKAGQWNTIIADNVYKNAIDCLRPEAKERLSSTIMKDRFEKLKDLIVS